jgi:hypothetical protein
MQAIAPGSKVALQAGHSVGEPDGVVVTSVCSWRNVEAAALAEDGVDTGGAAADEGTVAGWRTAAAALCRTGAAAGAAAAGVPTKIFWQCGQRSCLPTEPSAIWIAFWQWGHRVSCAIAPPQKGDAALFHKKSCVPFF